MPDHNAAQGMSIRDVSVDTCDPNEFDEGFYLQRHPDIAAGVERGYFASGWDHYTKVGLTEGREAKFRGFDAGFYRRSYPMALEDIKAGLASDLKDHYERHGKARGYIPDPHAARPDNPTGMVSRFGGLWLDRPDALDIIAGKEEIGQISDKEADNLRFWVKNGYIILPQSIPEPTLDAACAAMESAYSGKIDKLLFECPAAVGSRDFKLWMPEMNNHPAKALDMHFQSPEIRDLQFSPAICRTLEILFQSKALASQTLGFWRGSAQEGHQDTAYVAYTRSRDFAASWIALEDVTLGAGELFYHEGSHKLDDFLYGGASKTIHDCRRMNGGEFPVGEASAFIKSLKDRTEQFEMISKSFSAKRGDVLIWHADLVHGGNAVSKSITRKSVVTHYCPTRLAPLYFEDRPVKVYSHGQNKFASGIYLHAEPKMR